MTTRRTFLGFVTAAPVALLLPAWATKAVADVATAPAGYVDPRSRLPTSTVEECITRIESWFGYVVDWYNTSAIKPVAGEELYVPGRVRSGGVAAIRPATEYTTFALGVESDGKRNEAKAISRLLVSFVQSVEYHADNHSTHEILYWRAKPVLKYERTKYGKLAVTIRARMAMV